MPSVDVEVETLPGVFLGHKNVPVAGGRRLHSRWQVPTDRVGAT